MSKLTALDKYFLEDSSRLQRGTKSIAQRTKSTEEDVIIARKKHKTILSASSLLEELNDRGYTGDIKETVATIINNPKESLDFKMDSLRRQYESKNKDIQARYNTLLREYENLDLKYNDNLRLDDYPQVACIPKYPQYERQGASLIIYSDWHVGQIVDKSSLNGLNEYNPEIARQRANKCFDSTIKLINKDVPEFNQHTTVIFLNGDFINGYIHPDAQRITNSMTPIEEVLFAQELLISGLNSILENSKTDKIICICHNGNHARQEKRMESSIDHRTSYETMLYSSLAQKFKDEIEFVIPKSDLSYTNILGKKIRAYHGHQMKFSGGIGGLSVPLTKFIHRQDQNIKADYNIMSHYHQCSMPTKNTMLNGSLVGMDNYCQTIGAQGEPPLQAYRLLDSKYGFTSFNPIFC